MDSDPGMYRSHSLRNPTAHWIGSFETRRRTSWCAYHVQTKLDPEVDKRLKNRLKELQRYCQADSYLQCRWSRTVGQAPKKWRVPDVYQQLKSMPSCD